jgi:hypothetical protein
MSSFSRSTWACTRRSASPQQGLLVDEVATDHAVLRILPVPDEQSGRDRSSVWSLRPSAPRPGRARKRSSTSCSLFHASWRPRSKRRSPAPGSKFLTLARIHGQERGGAFAPTRPRDVDLADAAHAVLVEVGPDGVSRLPARPRAWPARPGSPRPRRAAEKPPPSGCGRITSATSRSASPISDVTLWGTDCVSVSASVLLAQPRLQLAR